MRDFWALALCALLVAQLGGCAGNRQDGALSESQAEHTIEAALRDVENIYYRETEASEVVDAGLRAIHERYPAVLFSREGDEIVATVDGNPIHRVATQDDGGAATEWAEQVALMLVRISAALRGENKPDLADLTDTLLDGFTDNLDPFSGYVSAHETRAKRQRSQGKLGTVGVVVKPEDRGLRIIQIHNATAVGSGLLRRGDLIIEIKGVPTAGITESTFHDLILGAVGTPIDLTILRPDNPAPLVVIVQRERDDANTVAAFRKGDFQRIVVVRFYERTVNDLRALLSDLKNNSQPVKGVILDLRNNPGGLLDSALSTSDFFLIEGRILTTHGRHNDSQQNFVASSTPPVIEQSLVVLVDQHSAAGSEIVAAALQDNGRAVVVGIPTFGKGTIQTALPMPNRGILGLTWTEMHAPAGYRLHKRGVMPTVCTGGSVTAEEVVDALRHGGGFIDRAIRIRDIDPTDTAAVEAFRALCPPRADGAEDVALEVATAILADSALYDRVLAAAQ